jgi:hypothetical protein
MAWTTRLLVVANRTLESEELSSYLCSRAEQGPLRVTFVVPAAPSEEQAAHARLAAVLDELNEQEGISAEGTIGDSEPYAAAMDVFDARSYDEIVVSTLPNATSQWLLIDLPHRLRRSTDAVVSHVVSSEPRVVPAAVPLAAVMRPRPPWFERLFPLRSPDSSGR